MTIESIRESISFNEILGLIPKFIEARKRNTTVAEGVIWRRVLNENGYNPELVSYIYDNCIDKKDPRYMNTIKEALIKSNKGISTNTPTRHKINNDGGIQHPAMDVADPHLLRENVDFIQNY